MVCRNYLQYACSHILSKLILAVKKKAHLSGTGGGPPAPSFTPAEELALDLNQGRPVMEGIQGGTATDCVPPAETALLIHGTFSSTAHQTQSSIYTGICGLSDLVLPCSVRGHSYTPATSRRSSEYY